MLPSLWLLPLAALLASPGPKPRPAPPVTTFSGHLAHAPAGDTVRLQFGGHWYKRALSADGDFRLELPQLAAPTPAWFELGRQHTYCYLTPGDQLHLALDFNDFDKTLTYSGRGANANNYLARSLYQFEFGPPDGRLPRPSDMLKPTTTPAAMRQWADAFRQQRQAFLTQYAQAHPLPAAFQHDAAFTIDLAWGHELLDYVEARRHDSAAPPLPATYFDFVAQLPLAELGQHLRRSLNENTDVIGFLYAYQNRLASSGNLSTDPAEGPRLYALATQELGDTEARDQAMRMLMLWRLDGGYLPGALTFYRTFRLHNADSTLARQLRQNIARRVKLETGRPAPAFVLRDLAGNTVSLADFRGKVVYLDFWGTWCAPCLKELTGASPGLRQQFAGRDVVFLYVSENDPEARWRQTLAAQHLADAGTVHLHDPEGTVAADYQVNSYPTYWLIGRDGRILIKNAPRPSDGVKTVAAIEAALGQ